MAAGSSGYMNDIIAVLNLKVKTLLDGEHFKNGGFLFYF
jgi:hypothetical protein